MRQSVAGLILAGGRGRRLGERDKAFVHLGQQPLIAHVFARLEPQCAMLLISANGDPARFAAWPVAVVPDATPDFPGPLAGLLAGLDRLAATHPNVSAMVSVSVDTPFLPDDLVTRLVDAGQDAQPVCAVSAGRRHPVVALWPVALREAMRLALAGDGGRSVDRFLMAHRGIEVSWPDAPLDPFFNINQPHDLDLAHQLLAKGAGHRQAKDLKPPCES